MKANFIECKDVESANQVSLDDYVFMERMSEKLGLYVFKIRERQRK